VAQAAYQLERGQLWLPGESSSSASPVCRLGDLAFFGPIDRDIDGIESGGRIIRGPFDITEITPGSEPTYPVLWAHRAAAERGLIVAPDSQAVIRHGRNPAEETRLRERADGIWKTAGRCHFNRDFRFNSQSTAAVLTERPTIGGRAWPSVNFRDPRHEPAFVLWANSTFGLLLHWWRASKQQSGRGSITLTRLPDLPTFDLRTLSEETLGEAVRRFDELKALHLSPFDQIDIDGQRHEIDAALGPIFGVPDRLLGPGGPLDLLRRKLAREPSITGGRERE
jgi:hypothetical protein